MYLESSWNIIDPENFRLLRLYLIAIREYDYPLEIKNAILSRISRACDISIRKSIEPGHILSGSLGIIMKYIMFEVYL